MSTAIFQNALSSLTGNVPKAILFVRKLTSLEDTVDKAANDADSLRDKLNLLQATAGVLSQGSLTYSTIKSSGVMSGSGYLALEVQYNPNTIYLSTQGSGNKIQYSGGNLGGESINQTVQNFDNAVSTLSCQLVFDAVNVADAFMLENMNLSLSNTVSTASSAVKKLLTGTSGYTVQPQMEGIMSLLTHTIIKQVIFSWGKMFFRGELTRVESNYTMFNKSGDPVRGTVDISITQSRESEGDKEYWDEVFTSVFGASGLSVTTGSSSLLSQITSNNFLNLNL